MVRASRGREPTGGPVVARAFQPEPCGVVFASLCQGFQWLVAPSPPTPLPRFTGARGELAVSQASRGREPTGGPLCSSGIPARALWSCFCESLSGISGFGGPLTPDPSPPFHGGEGRISSQPGEPWAGAHGWPCL